MQIESPRKQASAVWRLLAAMALSLAAALAQAQPAARILSGYPPGGALDARARIFAEPLSSALERPFVVETRTGAAGQIAAMALKASLADGTTLMVVPDSAITLYPHTVKSPVYDTLNDFIPIAHIGSYDIGFAVGPAVPPGDFRDWEKWAREGGRNVTYGSAGAGTNLHFLGVMLGQATGLKLEHVAYRGVGPAIADLLGGQVPAVMLPLAQLLQQSKAGKARLLAHSGSRRSPSAPDVPTFKELGFAAMEITGWYLLIAPAGVPPDLVARLNGIVNQSMRAGTVRDRLRGLDLEIHEMAPADIAAKLRAEHERWRPIVRASGFRADAQ